MKRSINDGKLSQVTVDKKSIRFEHGKLPNGVEAIYAIADEYYAPVAFLYYRHILIDHIEVLYLSVHDRCRRQGIARMALNELMRWYSGRTICTALGNELSTPWLEACGFRHNKLGWFKRPERTK